MQTSRVIQIKQSSNICSQIAHDRQSGKLHTYVSKSACALQTPIGQVPLQSATEPVSVCTIQKEPITFNRDSVYRIDAVNQEAKASPQEGNTCIVWHTHNEYKWHIKAVCQGSEPFGKASV